MAHFPEHGLKLQLLAVALIAVLVFLHYLLWLDENGARQTQTLRISIRAQTDENAELAEHNHALAAEIEDLKRGLMAIEERARSDMGMIRPDETFYRLLDKPAPPTPPASPHPSSLPAKPGPAAKPSVQAVKPTPPASSPPRAASHPMAKTPSPAPTPKPAPPTPSPTQASKPTPPVKPAPQSAKPAPTAGTSPHHE